MHTRYQTQDSWYREIDETANSMEVPGINPSRVASALLTSYEQDGTRLVPMDSTGRPLTDTHPAMRMSTNL